MINVRFSFFVVLAVLFACSDAVYSNGNFTLGEKSSKNVLIYTTRVNATAQRGIYAEKSLTFQGSNPITLIEAIDVSKNRTGGNVQLVKGGILAKNVTLQIQSQYPGWGFQYVVNVYEKRKRFWFF